jgi:uncharacterized protein (DUF885 family)
MTRLALWVAVLLLQGCAARGGSWATLAARLHEQQLDAHPQQAVSLGLHRYDGRLPALDAASLQRELARLRRARDELLAVELTRLTPRARLEHDALLTQVRAELFRLEELRQPWRDPASSLAALELSDYVSRPYAEVGERARAVIALCRGVPAYLAAARTNLEPRLPRPLLEHAIRQLDGLIRFAGHEVPVALSGAPGGELRRALALYVGELKRHQAFLEERRAAATEGFALGEQRFLRMLAATQNLELSLATLERIGREDLRRNRALLEEAARAVDPRRSTAEVVEQVAADKPPAHELLALATRQMELARRLTLERGLVTPPASAPIATRESPSFLRWNFAFLDAAGPHERRKLPSYFYVSPPDPTWTAERQRAYLPSRADLLFTAVHEAWPGHFVARLKQQEQPSTILRGGMVSTVAEGWAHYAEELLWEEALREDPRLRVGQLRLALLRNVRFLVAVGLHARGMSLDEARRLFVEQAFADPVSAEQQAVRGIFDPMYLCYTLGKLVVRKLRDDWRARVGPRRELRELHDALLAIGMAPSLPAIRRELLGPDAGPVL